MQKSQGGLAGSVLSVDWQPLQFGGQEVPALRQLLEEGGTRKVLHLAFLANPGGQVVMVLLKGREGQEDREAYAAFGQGVRLEGYQPLKPGSGADGAPSGAASPAASGTEETTPSGPGAQTPPAEAAPDAAPPAEAEPSPGAAGPGEPEPAEAAPEPGGGDS